MRSMGLGVHIRHDKLVFIILAFVHLFFFHNNISSIVLQMNMTRKYGNRLKLLLLLELK